MPQFVVAALVGAGLYAGLSWLSRQLLSRPEDEPKPVPVTPSAKDLGALERDPVTGIYRPTLRRDH